MVVAERQPADLMGWMDSLADATRLRLLHLLENQELGVAELCDVLQMPQSTVSRHLKLLETQAWVRHRRQGTTNLYAMTPSELEGTARRLWLLAREQTEDWPALQQDRLRLAARLKHRQRTTQDFFADSADQWDTLRARMYGRCFPYKALISLLPAKWTVADLGCGTAALTAELAQCVNHVIGVDQSATMLEAARQRVGALKNVELRQGDLQAIPLDDQSCDAAVLILALGYVPNPASVLKETSRILRQGGKTVIIDVLNHDREDFRRRMGQQQLGFKPSQLRSTLEAVGLACTSCRPLEPEPGTQGPALVLASATKIQP